MFCPPFLLHVQYTRGQAQDMMFALNLAISTLVNVMNLRTLILVTLAVTLSGTTLQAQTMLLNFGGTSYSGTDAPGHVDGSATGTTWNTIATDMASGILDENGNATGIAVDFGTSSGFGTTLDYSSATRAADVSSTVGLGVFNTDLMSGNAVRDAGGLDGIGLNVSGLTAGQYIFYFTGFRGDGTTNAGHDYEVYAGVGADAITDFASLSVGTITNSNWNDASNSWIAGDNYITGEFTIDGTNDNFSLLVTSEEPFIGVLSSLEIVAVPEPSSYAGIFGAFLLMSRVIRRRRK